jgi:hypothetical protein
MGTLIMVAYPPYKEVTTLDEILLDGETIGVIYFII